MSSHVELFSRFRLTMVLGYLCLYQSLLYILLANNNLSIFPVQRQEKSLLSPCKETMSRCVEHVFVQISPTVLPVLFNSWVSRSFPEAIVKNKSGQFQI